MATIILTIIIITVIIMTGVRTIELLMLMK